MSKYINNMIRIGDSSKSATDVNAINIHGSSHRVGINTNPTGYMFDVSGSFNCSTLSINNKPVALGGHWTKSGTAVSYSDGNVGIGISTPAYLLDVNGTINSTTLQLKNNYIKSTSNNQIIMNIGRGDVYFEKNTNSTIDGTVKPGLTLRVSDNPTNGSLFDVRSSGDDCRLFVGQSITTPGGNSFYFGHNNTSNVNTYYDTSKYNGVLNSGGITLYNGAVFTGDLVGNATTSTTATTSGSCTGNAATATQLQTARTIGGVSFNGTANINLPGVNTAGNQNTSGNAATATTSGSCTGNAATATQLQTARTIGGVSFNGTANINLPGVNTAGNQNTSGNAATSTVSNAVQCTTTLGDHIEHDGAFYRYNGQVFITVNDQFYIRDMGSGTGNTFKFKFDTDGGQLTATSFNATSDLTLKTNISELNMPLEKILNIEGRNYTWKEDTQDVLQTGLIAQQVEEHIPEVIVTNKENNIKTINYNGIIPYLVEGMKEQQRQIEAQRSEIEDLKAMVKSLVDVTSLIN